MTMIIICLIDIPVVWARADRHSIAASIIPLRCGKTRWSLAQF